MVCASSRLELLTNSERNNCSETACAALRETERAHGLSFVDDKLPRGSMLLAVQRRRILCHSAAASSPVHNRLGLRRWCMTNWPTKQQSNVMMPKSSCERKRKP